MPAVIFPIADENPIGYPIRTSSLIASLGIHCTVILLIGLASSSKGLTERLAVDISTPPRERKIIYYDFRKKLPEVVSGATVGKSPEPRGAEQSKRAVIATSQKAKSSEQLIWLPTPKIELQKDVAVPDLIARLNVRLPTLPAPPKETPPKPEPKGDPDRAQVSEPSPARAAKAPKIFVPPTPVSRPQLAMQIPVLEASAQAGVSTPSTTLAVGQGLSGVPTASPSQRTAPPAPMEQPGNATVDIAVANLHPKEREKSELPSGARPGQFSKAPTTGDAATGAGNESSLVVPGLTVRKERSGTSPGLDASRAKPILYSERVRSVPLSTLSVPLRPASRSIPRALETRFQGRSVYTMVVPIENLPVYAGDWIVWFAERNPKPGEMPLVRAPVPFRKLELAEQIVSGGRAGQRVQIAAILEKDGQLKEITVLTAVGPVLEKMAMQDLASWEFKPATRNGSPMDVEVVVEIPFSLPPAVSQRVQP